jgi:putative transposase
MLAITYSPTARVARAPPPGKGRWLKSSQGRSGGRNHHILGVSRSLIDLIFSGRLMKSQIQNSKAAGEGARSTNPRGTLTQASLKGKYEYRRRLPHGQRDDRALFVTFCCGCLDRLTDSARDIVLRHCLHDQGTKAVIHAVVVMPDHVHLLLTPLRDADRNLVSLVGIVQAIKGASAHSLNRALGRSGPVWQEESFDHVLRSEASFSEKLEYIRQNPVRRGLVTRPEDYPWLWVE